MKEPHRVSLQDAVAVRGRELELVQDRGRIFDVFGGEVVVEIEVKLLRIHPVQDPGDVFADGLPVNMPTHAHGQGYSDLNFLIPELVSRVAYKKGPYFAEEGDFSSAGAADIDYYTKMPKGIASLGLGSNGYRRAMADS